MLQHLPIAVQEELLLLMETDGQEATYLTMKSLSTPCCTVQN